MQTIIIIFLIGMVVSIQLQVNNLKAEVAKYREALDALSKGSAPINSGQDTSAH